eukprot:TRINITY_DN17221_c0_g1_i1.p2 TRINITY_DN17221_c0_g1~~TRINITY_DN17221_c0_g1_i1.p2  ORF type:complete len:79 (-),score=12.45 TRINITY_DN17221_c0_g1_i1:377-613(-)
MNFHEFISDVVEMLQTVMGESHLVLIVTKPLVFQKALKSAETLLHSEYLGQLWSQFVKYRIVLNRFCNIQAPKKMNGY